MRTLSEHEIKNVMSLSPGQRYGHTIKLIADWEEVWSLYSDGWSLAGEEEEVYMPIWPAKEYAAKCATGSWESYEPHKIELQQLLSSILPDLQNRGIGLVVFITPDSPGVPISIEEFLKHLDSELDKY